MKQLTKLLSLFAIASLVIFMSCGPDDSGNGNGQDDNPPPPDNPFLEAATELEGTWGVSESGVTNNDETRSEWAEAGFTIEFTVNSSDPQRGNYTVTNLPDFEGFERVWATSGTWRFNGDTDNPNTNQITRDDDIVMDISNDGTTAILTFTIPEESASVDGDWSFTLNAQ